MLKPDKIDISLQWFEIIKELQNASSALTYKDNDVKKCREAS